MSRAYLRVDPGLYERKVIEQGYPLGAFAALVGCFCYGEVQPTRGTFRDAKLLRAHLGPAGRWVPYLIEHEDLIEQPQGSLYIDGWKEWQEHDLAVPERMRRLRARRNERDGAKRNGVTPENVTGRNSGGGGAAKRKPRAARRNDGAPVALSDVLDS